VEFMDSVSFCGLTCHTVMKPEYTAYGYSPHARVRCVDCHIGPGADWYVRSKLSGVRQVFAVLFDTYETPIPTPVENLRPARETCEECHWPRKFHGDRIRVRTHHLEDEPSTPATTVLVLKVGGGGSEGREASGIHWHVDPANRIRYAGNKDRSEIYWVEVAGPGGGTREYLKSGHERPSAEEDGAEIRTLDCMDCHNRPTHNFETPEDAVDRMLDTGMIDRSLPYIRREAARVLRTEVADGEAAGRAFPESLRAYYGREYPALAAERDGEIRSAGEALAAAWTRSVFPEMKVTWGTYPEHIGHRNFPGCFRCHDEEHATEAGETISQACDTCHTLLAVEEQSPEILREIFPQ
jgi:nitrate/TMAO reductase-like tetraheme cytochrome c subunit